MGAKQLARLEQIIADLQRKLDVIAGRPILMRKDLARHFGKSVRTIDRWKAEKKKLPKPVYLHGRGTGSVPMWRPCDIDKMETPQ